MKCCFKSCNNKVFKTHDKCALHCFNSNIQVDKDDFNVFCKLLFSLLSEKILEHRHFIESKDGKILNNYSESDFKHINITEDEDLKIKIGRVDISIENIIFPKNEDKYNNILNCMTIAKYLGRINFIKCQFDNDNFIGVYNSYYDNCIFTRDISIIPHLVINTRTLIPSEDYKYKKCSFKGDVKLSSSIFGNKIDYNFFKNCDFENNIYISGLTIENNVFSFSELPESKKKIKDFDNIKKCYKIKNLFISDCIFESNFKINGINKKQIMDFKLLGFSFEDDTLTMNILEIVNTKFKSKFEIKYRIIEDFRFENSNVDGIFDVYRSSFIKARFHKSIFEEFAAFEYVVFGDGKRENITDFIYTTFKDFSNFRNTKFTSGLNFSSANIKQEPNFLNTDINLEGTDRETLRIIKNSFEKVNNKIESNRFFIYEMIRYRKEISGDVEESVNFLKLFFRVVFSCNEYVLNIIGSGHVFKNIMSTFSKKFVLSSNYYISRFGESYIQPFIIFLFSISVYTGILEVHKDIFSEKPIARYAVLLRNFVTQDWFVSLSKILNACAANVPLFSKALENKSGIQFISLLFFIWFGILTWQIIVAVKRNTQH